MSAPLFKLFRDNIAVQNAADISTVNACLEVHHSLRAKVHQFKTYF